MPNQQSTGVTAVETVDGDAGDQQRPAPTGQTRDDFHARERAAFLAGAPDEGDAAEGGGEEQEQPKPKKVIGAPKPDVEDDADDDAADAEPDLAVDAAPDDDDEDESDSAADDDADQDDEDELAAKAKADPELAKRLAAVRRTEQRHREGMARERASFDRERSEWQSQAKQLTEAQKRFESLAARVRYNPTAVLRELGLIEDDFEAAAQHIASHSKAAGVTPAHRAAAERAMREREAADKATRAEERVEKLEQTIAQRERQAAEEQEVTAYLGRVARKATDETPLTKALVAKNPTRAREDLAVTAFALAQKLGQRPKAAAVVAAHEKKLARQLRDLGIEPPTAKPPAGKGAAAGKAKPGAAIVAPTKTEPAAHVNGATVLPTRVVIPSRDEMVRELEELS